MYGGGMGEIGAGRAQNQYLASLFHAEAPNDLAPVAYNEIELVPNLPQSPLLVPTPAVGLTPTQIDPGNALVAHVTHASQMASVDG